MSIDPVSILERLSAKRPVFHSEADFQHALAWQLHEINPSAHVRLEYRMPTGAYVDVWVWTDLGPLAIELKYLTKLFSVEVAGERFDLTQHAAHPPRRYDFVKDIGRLERIAGETPRARGWAILLTNDPVYWQDSGRLGGIDAEFRLHEGRTLQGTLNWAEHAGPGTISGRELALALTGAYRLRWRDYSTIGGRGPGRFRYLAIQVPPVEPPGHLTSP